MGRNNTRAAKNIAKMYEQLGLTQDDIFHKTKLLLSIYRDVVWATLSDCRCVNAEINYYGDDLNDALIYLEEFAPDIERSEFEHRVCNLFENKWIRFGIASSPKRKIIGKKNLVCCKCITCLFVFGVPAKDEGFAFSRFAVLTSTEVSF